ncbi:MAG: FAD-binding oxidoreductase [Deltaproteobacteria bacterium]|nr:FAD-binding oxidoreductase [Deltaproteobacteria bacterium]
MQKCYSNIVVIGGGVIGASVAYHLSRAGLSVVLLDKDGLTSGASGACSGKIWLGTKQPGLHLRLAQLSLEMLQNFISFTGSRVECEESGEMLLIESEAELDPMQAFVDGQKSVGIDIKLLDLNGTRKMQPGISDTIAGSTYSPIGISVNPVSLVYALIEEAERLGTRILRNAVVRSIEVSSDRIHSITTNHGKIGTDYLVNAAGVNAPEIGKMAGLEIPITPLQGEIIVTEPVAPVVRIPSSEAGYIAVKRNPGLIKQMDHAGVTCGISQSERGNVYIGASKQFVGHNTSSSVVGIRTLARRAVRFFPSLSDVKMIRAYAGLRPYTSDGLPILGKVDSLEGFIMAAGHGGDGIALSMITGHIIERIISGKTVGVPMEKLVLKRFLN